MLRANPDQNSSRARVSNEVTVTRVEVYEETRETGDPEKPETRKKRTGIQTKL